MAWKLDLGALRCPFCVIVLMSAQVDYGKARHGFLGQGRAGQCTAGEKGRTCALSFCAVLFDRPIDFPPWAHLSLGLAPVTLTSKAMTTATTTPSLPLTDSSNATGSFPTHVTNQGLSTSWRLSRQEWKLGCPLSPKEILVCGK